MRKLILLFVAVMAFGCSDDSSAPVNNTLVGTWKITYRIYNGVQYPASDCLASERLKFNADGTYSITASLEGQTCQLLGPYTGTYEVHDNILTYTNSEGAYDCEIFAFGENQLQVASLTRGSSSKDNYVRE